MPRNRAAPTCKRELATAFRCSIRARAWEHRCSTAGSTPRSWWLVARRSPANWSTWITRCHWRVAYLCEARDGGAAISAMCAVAPDRPSLSRPAAKSARGGWSELSFKVSRYWSLHPGWTLDNPVTPDVPSGGRTRNSAFYIGNRIAPGGSLLIGVDYLRWTTNYQGFGQGIDNRVNLFL